jgi:adenylate cyclase
MDFLKKILKSLLIGSLVGTGIALFTKFLFADLIDRLEYVSYYMRYRWEYSYISKDNAEEFKKKEYGIHIVDIDDRSMQKMGVYSNWDRSYHADMVKNLSAKYPSAIVFDILFSSPEDRNHRNRLEKLLIRSKEIDPSIALTDQIRQSIISTIDYDLRFVEETRKSGCVYLGLCLSDENDYKDFALSQIQNKMTMAYHDSLNPQSCIEIPEDKKATIIDRKTIIDGIFPSMAQAAKAIGHVDIIPSEDGVIREVPLLYKYGDFKPVYLPLSIRTVASLFATPNEEILYEPQKHINIGKPFKIFKDKEGNISVSYPNFTFAQVKAVLKNSNEILKLKPDQKLEITTSLIASRDSSGCISLEMNVPGVLPCQVTDAIFAADIKKILSMKDQEEVPIGEEIIMRRDSESDWVISAPFDAGEWYLTQTELATLSMITKEDLEFISPGERKLVFFNMHARNYDGEIFTNIPCLRGETLKELCKSGLEPILEMKPGFRMDYGKTVFIPLTKHNHHLITFFGPKGKPFPAYSYYDIYSNRVQGELDGKIFIAGSTAPALFDIKAVPIDKSYPAVEIHASLINSFLTNTFMKRLPAWQDMLILLMVGIIIGFLSYMFKPLWGSILAALSIFIYFLIAMSIFSNSHIWIEVARPVLTIFLAFASVMVYRYITEEKDRKFLQSTFKQYLSPDLIDIMYKQKQLPALGGEEGVRTAYFTDIQGFSTFSEKLGSPTRLVELLNEYLSRMTDILLAHYGTLDKYEGDAIIAFFGAPMKMEDHAQQACLTALDMQNALGDLRKKWVSEGDKWPQIVHEMRMRIGINTGLITTGNMGSTIRKNYTMMGDAVNLAARLESAAKQYGVFTMISNFTYDMIKNEFEARMLDKIQVVGKSEAVIVYELLAQKGTLDDNMVKLLGVYNEGLEYFYRMEWDRAISKMEEASQLEPFKHINKVTPSIKILEYCEMYRKNPPPPNWDGVMRLTSK